MVWNSILWRAAPTAAEIRFARFVEHIVERFTGGHRFLDDLPREVLADEVELAQLIGQGPAASGPANRPAGVDGR